MTHFSSIARIGWAYAAALAALATPAWADNYNFNVIYTGNNTATLAPGSDNPLTTTLVAGDTFTYTLTAPGYWDVLSNLTYFDALWVAPGGSRTIDFSYDFLYYGTSELSGTQSNVTDIYVHLGSGVNLTSGLLFNELTFSGTILAGSDPSTAQSILPFSGAPEHGIPNPIAYFASVPEPASWALMLIGFAGVGLVVRSKRRTLAATAA